MDDARAIEIGRIVAAWDRFEWAPGMRAISYNGFARHIETVARGVAPWHAFNAFWIDDAVPDLRDRPTQAAVLERIEKAVGGHVYLCPSARPDVDADGQNVTVITWAVASLGVIWNGSRRESRAEAIAAAVEELSR